MEERPCEDRCHVKMAVYKLRTQPLGEATPAGLLTLDFWSPQLEDSRFPLLKPPVCGALDK